MFISKCPLRKLKPPALACDCDRCDWYIDDVNYKNCFWALADFIAKNKGFTFSYDSIANKLGISVQEVVEIEEAALSNLRRHSLQLFSEDLSSDD